MLAHFRPEDGKEQTLAVHARNVAALTSSLLRGFGLSALGMLVGLLHDMGKANRRFQTYLRDASAAAIGGEDVQRAAPHSPVGAIWVYERYFDPRDKLRGTVAQLAAMAILGHHSGLADCLDFTDPDRSAFLKAMSWDKAELSYAESVTNFFAVVAKEGELDALVDKAAQELAAFAKRFPKGLASFGLAMTARLVLGALTDADRWDTACFEHEENPLLPPPEPRWQAWRANLEAHMTRFPVGEGIAKLRAEISEDCRRAGACRGAGVYRLTVPTGGGKTLASLRFALEQACGGRQETARLFYIAPFNTILEQNAAVIREALGEDELLLEHHADVVLDPAESEQEQRHRLLTERWTSRIILTSMVQLLQALFMGGNTNARRMPRLGNSILIFDEIQALPRKCTVLFECAARYLADCMGCTVLLCTATQPTLRQHETDMPFGPDLADRMDAKPPLGADLLPDTAALFEQLRRVRFVDQRCKPRTNAAAACDVAALLQDGQSVLMVVNTKRAAREIFKDVRTAAADSVCFHLTTDMCAAHRKDVLARLRAALDARRADESAPPVCCISTALIEAGVDISFPVVIRSMAGLPSLLQAAGRCNRNRETDCGTVYIWRLQEEDLSHLPEIRQAQQDSDSILDQAKTQGACIDRPEMIEAYFRQALHNDVKRPQELFYRIEPRPGEALYLANLLGRNERLCSGLEDRVRDPRKRLFLLPSWRMVGDHFKVIDQDTVAVISPYGRGAEIIAALESVHSFQEEKAWLKEAQLCSVQLYRQKFDRLRDAGAVFPLGETGAWALRTEHYHPETGLVYEPGEMEFLNA